MKKSPKISPWFFQLGPSGTVQNRAALCDIRASTNKKRDKTESREECFLIDADVVWRAWFEGLISGVRLRPAGDEWRGSAVVYRQRPRPEVWRTWQTKTTWRSKALCLYTRLLVLDSLMNVWQAESATKHLGYFKLQCRGRMHELIKKPEVILNWKDDTMCSLCSCMCPARHWILIDMSPEWSYSLKRYRREMCRTTEGAAQKPDQHCVGPTCSLLMRSPWTWVEKSSCPDNCCMSK